MGFADRVAGCLPFVPGAFRASRAGPAGFRGAGPMDEAINALGNDDREAIMLRFFEQQSFRALGEIVGSSEDAARMRVNRALEKLHG